MIENILKGNAKYSAWWKGYWYKLANKNMFLLAENIMPGAEKLQEELLFREEKQYCRENQIFSE